MQIKLRPLGHGGTRFTAIVVLSALVGFAVLAISLSKQGDAAFPGSNGKIAYANGSSAYQTSIWSANPDGSSPTQLTSGTGDWNPAYSADGQRIAFEREGGVMVMNADGSGLAQLVAGSYSNSSGTPEYLDNYENPQTHEPIPHVRIQTYTETWHRFNGPSFSPDGSQLAVSESQGTYTNRVICEVASEGQECLDYGYGSYGGYGGGGYYHSEPECTACTSHIVTLNSSSGAVTGQVTPASSSSTAEDFDPSYAADGKLAFARWTPEASALGIYVVSSPGATPSQVTSGSYDWAPNFSPDSSRIVFVRGHQFGLVGAGGGSVTLLSALPLPAGTPLNRSNLESPAFSPDGSRLTFRRTAFGSGGTERGIFTMGVDGSGLTKIVDGGFGPDWQAVQPSPPVAAVPPPEPANPPKGKVKKGKVRLNRKSLAVIGTITCGSSPCRLKVLSSKLKLKLRTSKHRGGKKSSVEARPSRLELKKGKKGGKGKKTCSPNVQVPKRLAPGKSAKVKVKVTGKCLAGLQRAHKALLAVRIRVSDAQGVKVLAFRSTLLPPKHGHKKGHRKKRQG